MSVTFFFIFVFKQKTAYELRISDWSSDVCSSDLHAQHGRFAGAGIADHDCQVVLAGDMRQRVLLLASQRKPSTPGGVSPPHFGHRRETMPFPSRKIGRASSRARVFQYVYISVVAVTLNKNNANSFQLSHIFPLFPYLYTLT